MTANLSPPSAWRSSSCRGHRAAGRAELPPIEPVDRSRPLPLSFAQQRLWFLEQLGAPARPTTSPRACGCGASWTGARWSRALDRIVARHEALRTTFARGGRRAGAADRAGGGEPPSGSPSTTWRGQPSAEAELRRLMAEEAGAPFDLAARAADPRPPDPAGGRRPRAAPDHAPHRLRRLVAWGCSTRELGALYAAFRDGEPDPLPALPMQYADYAVWQRRWVEGEVLQAQADYWKQTLAGAPELLELPTDRPRPAQQDSRGARGRGRAGRGADGGAEGAGAGGTGPRCS